MELFLLQKYIYFNPGIRVVEKLSETKSFKDIGARLWDMHHPGCKQYEYRSDDYWRCYIRHHTLTTSHQSGTCKMGSQLDNSTVVDPNLRSVNFRILLSIEWNLIRLGGSAHGIVTKTVNSIEIKTFL